MKFKMSLFIVILTVGAQAMGGGDLLPIRYRTNMGEVQLQKNDAFHWIDNTAAYLNPDSEGMHKSTYLYKAKDLPDVPHLEVRYKGTKGLFKLEIKKGKSWQKVAILSTKSKGWVEKKFELRDGVSAFANTKGEVEVRIISIKKGESLELDYMAITADQGKEATIDTAALGF